MRPNRTTLFLNMATLVASRSTCSRLQVGCVLTDLDGERIWVGYNGGPRKGRNHCARPTPGNCGCIHAEANAVGKADSHVEKVAYLTVSPCEHCAIMLVNNRVRHVHVRSIYRTPSAGLAVLREAGVPLSLHPAGFTWRAGA